MNTIGKIAVYPLALIFFAANALMGQEPQAGEADVPDMMRSWTTKDNGFKVEAKAEKADDKSVTLRRKDNGKTVSVPLDKLSEEDVAWIEENRAYIGKSEDEIRKMILDNVILKDLKGKTYGLVNGRWKKKPAKETAQYIIVYFSASWCGPCRRSAPHSVSVYNDKIAAMPGLEVVMRSMDKVDADAETWAKKEKMPWPILPYSKNIDAFKKVAPRGIPNLKLLNAKGELIAEGNMDSLVKKAEELLNSEK